MKIEEKSENVAKNRMSELKRNYRGSGQKIERTERRF